MKYTKHEELPQEIDGQLYLRIIQDCKAVCAQMQALGVGTDPAGKGTAEPDQSARKRGQQPVKFPDWIKPGLRDEQWWSREGRPYDLAVITTIVIAKHHLGKLLSISNDTTLPHWTEAVDLCKKVLGHDPSFQRIDDEVEGDAA